MGIAEGFFEYKLLDPEGCAVAYSMFGFYGFDHDDIAAINRLRMEDKVNDATINPHEVRDDVDLELRL